jgi:hypothetical protein
VDDLGGRVESECMYQYHAFIILSIYIDVYQTPRRCLEPSSVVYDVVLTQKWSETGLNHEFRDMIWMCQDIS